MKRCIAMLLAVVMLLTMTACGAKEDVSVVGTWEAEIDYAKVINTCMAENEVLKVTGATAEKAPVKVTYVFEEDGIVSCTIDKEQLHAHLMVLFREILAPIAALAGKTIEEYVATAGQTDEELLISLFTEGVYKNITEALVFNGGYTVSGDKLTVTADGHTLQATVKREGDTLTLSAAVGTNTATDAQAQAVQALFPAAFRKVG
ncbi:MAG: hypothetical protein E7553_03835 [Ruminococcaceae bacterium]|nr:hypothetical protein [Oscillospiraceae bacterium]